MMAKEQDGEKPPEEQIKAESPCLCASSLRRWLMMT